MKNKRYLQTLTLLMSALLVGQVNAGGLTLGGPAVSEGNKWGFGSPKYDYATGKYTTPGIVWNGKGPAPEDGGAGVRELLSGSPYLKNAALIKRSDGSYVVNSKGAPNSVTQSSAPVYVPAAAPVIKLGSSTTKASTTTVTAKPIQKAAVSASVAQAASVVTTAAATAPKKLSLGGPAVSEGNKWGFGSPKYDYATGKYVSPGIVWNGKGPAPEDGGAGVKELLSSSPYLKNAALIKRSDGSYVINTKGVPNSVTVSKEPVYVPAAAPVIKLGSSMANTAAGAAKSIQKAATTVTTTDAIQKNETKKSNPRAVAFQALKKSNPDFVTKLKELRKERKKSNLTQEEFKKKRRLLIDTYRSQRSLSSTNAPSTSKRQLTLGGQ